MKTSFSVGFLFIIMSALTAYGMEEQAEKWLILGAGTEVDVEEWDTYAQDRNKEVASQSIPPQK